MRRDSQCPGTTTRCKVPRSKVSMAVPRFGMYASLSYLSMRAAGGVYLLKLPAMSSHAAIRGSPLPIGQASSALCSPPPVPLLPYASLFSALSHAQNSSSRWVTRRIKHLLYVREAWPTPKCSQASLHSELLATTFCAACCLFRGMVDRLWSLQHRPIRAGIASY